MNCDFLTISQNKKKKKLQTFSSEKVKKKCMFTKNNLVYNLSLYNNEKEMKKTDMKNVLFLK